MPEMNSIFLHIPFSCPTAPLNICLAENVKKKLKTIEDFVVTTLSLTAVSLHTVKKKTMHVIYRIYTIQFISHQVEEDVEWDIRVYTYRIQHVLRATHVCHAQLRFSLFPICIGLLRRRAQGSRHQLRPLTIWCPVPSVMSWFAVPV